MAHEPRHSFFVCVLRKKDAIPRRGKTNFLLFTFYLLMASLSSSSLSLKVFLYTERKTYWTFALEESLKVGTVLAQIADKLSTKNLTLFSRTKSRLGRRTDKVLKPSDSLFELSEKYRKKKKPYELYVQVGNAGDSRMFRVRSADRMSAPMPPVSLDFLDGDTPDPDARTRSSSASNTTPRLASSHSAPLYLEGNEGEVSPTPRLVEQPPKEAEEVLFSQNNSLQRHMSTGRKGTLGIATGTSFFRQGSIYGYISTPPNNSVHARLDLQGTETRKPARRRITDITASTPPTPANSLKPRDVAPIDHSAFFKHRSVDDVINQEKSTESFDNFYSLPAKSPTLDTLTIIRIYASDNGDLEGPCWTIAVAARTKAREACSIIENQLGIETDSLRVCIVDALHNTPRELKEERKITDDEKMLQVRDEWLKKGHIPYFFLREQTTDALFYDIPRPKPSPDMRAKKGAEKESDSSGIVFLGGDAFDSPAEPPSTVSELSASSSDSVTIDSSAWTMEQGIIKERVYNPHPNINHWIPSHELEKLHKVGDGGFAKVYKAKYKDKFVAVKTLKGVTTKEQLDSFRKEFEVLSLTTSPYLIRFYGASYDETDPSSPILSVVVEYCERGTLYKALNNKKIDIDWQTCFKWIHQTLNGILYLHNMTPQMVHRDIKTLNLLLDAKWNVKVADFGLSRSMSMTNKSSLGELKGTLAYCAPEIHKGMLFTPKSDSYSMAIVMWEIITRCVTGRYYAPYSEYSDIYHDFQIIFLTATQNRRPTIPPKTPDVLKDLLRQCWSGNPDDRPTCDEILLQIQSIYVQYQTEKIEWESRRQNEL
eukprot:Phypoly_transcript_02833.p1 GENE.Phypoly_transcript_02833~~Phypoly_transcript_02833.p1  ORF type:complete len:823 (+),score=121.95 Phypoly_transcript_02833:162-2630(+)